MEDSGPKSLPPRKRGAKLIFEFWGEIVLKYIEVQISKINTKIPCLGFAVEGFVQYAG